MGNEGNIFNSFIRTILTTISDTIDTISDSVGARTDAAEKFRVRFSADSAVTWFDDISVESTVNARKREASAAPTATDHIFNAGTQIVASAKSESGGNSIQIWIEIQEI